MHQPPAKQQGAFSVWRHGCGDAMEKEMIVLTDKRSVFLCVVLKMKKISLERKWEGIEIDNFNQRDI